MTNIIRCQIDSDLIQSVLAINIVPLSHQQGENADNTIIRSVHTFSIHQYFTVVSGTYRRIDDITS